jgi:uncharacterized protein
MKQTILIHGAPEEKEFYDTHTPSPSNSHWFPWLKKELCLRNELCQALEYPHPFDPSYQAWLSVFEQHAIDQETVLIGHSCGGGFLLRYLSEHPDIQARKVFLIAPWLDPAKTFTEDFFDFTLDADLAMRNEIHIFFSADDEESVLQSLVTIREHIPTAAYHAYVDKGHFTDPVFPELLELI